MGVEERKGRGENVSKEKLHVYVKDNNHHSSLVLAAYVRM